MDIRDQCYRNVWSMDCTSLDSLFPLYDGAMTKSEMDHIKLLQNFNNAKNFLLPFTRILSHNRLGNFTKKIILYPYILDIYLYILDKHSTKVCGLPQVQVSPSCQRTVTKGEVRDKNGEYEIKGSKVRYALRIQI